MKKSKNFKVEIRDNCLICGEAIKRPNRYRTYCSKKCRMRGTNQMSREYQKEWQAKKRGQKAPGKIQCIICGGWYYQVGSHIAQIHGMTARQYREEMDLPVRRGILPVALREKKARLAMSTGTYRNLKKGKKYRYKEGDKRAKQNTFYKGRAYEIINLPQEIYPNKVYKNDKKIRL